MWLTLVFAAYFCLALANFFDKYLLGGSLPSPKAYSFFAGILAAAILLIVPLGIFLSITVLPSLQKIFPGGFDILYIPDLSFILLSIMAGLASLAALIVYYQAIFKYEVSRVAPAVGGVVPCFTFVLVYLFSLLPIDFGFEKQIMLPRDYLAFVILIFGSLVLSIRREKIATFKSLKLALLASFLFSLSFVLSKLVYNLLPFWTGLIWIKIGAVLGSLLLLISPGVRKAVFSRKKNKGGLATTFILAKGTGALGGVLQNGAIFLAPAVFLPMINAMGGVQYVFLIIIATLFYFKFPEILKEEVSKRALSQKIIAILIIAIGLALFGLL